MPSPDWHVLGAPLYTLALDLARTQRSEQVSPAGSLTPDWRVSKVNLRHDQGGLVEGPYRCRHEVDLACH